MEEELLLLINNLDTSDQDRTTFTNAVNEGSRLEGEEKEKYFNDLRKKIDGHARAMDSSFEGVDRLREGEITSRFSPVVYTPDMDEYDQYEVGKDGIEWVDERDHSKGKKNTQLGLNLIKSSDTGAFQPTEFGYLKTELLDPVELEGSASTKYSIPGMLTGFGNLRTAIDTQYNNNLSNNQSSEQAWDNALKDVLGDSYDSTFGFDELNNFLSGRDSSFDLNRIKKGEESYSHYLKGDGKTDKQLKTMYDRLRDRNNWSLDENGKPQHVDLSKDKVENIIENIDASKADYDIEKYVNFAAKGWELTDVREGEGESPLTREDFNTEDFQSFIRDLKKQYPNTDINEDRILDDIFDLNKQRVKYRKVHQGWVSRAGEGAVNSFKTTAQQIVEFPQTAYAIGLTPINFVMDMAGYEEIDYADFGGEDYNNVLDLLSSHKENRDQLITTWNEANPIGESVWTELGNGNWSNFGRGTVIGLADSAGPTWAIMAMGFAGASMKTITAYGTPVFMAGELSEQREANPEMAIWELSARAYSSALAETAFSSIGTARIGKSWRVWLGDDAAEATVKVASKTAKDGFIKLTPKQAAWRDEWIKIYKEAWKKYPIFAGAGGEGIEEVMTQVTQNMIWGRPAFEGVGDAFVLGVAGGGFYSSPTSLGNAVKLIDKANTINKVNNELKHHRPGVKEDDLEEDSDSVPTIKNSLVTAYDPDNSSDISSSLLNILNIDGSLDLIDEAADNAVKDGSITQEKADAIKLNARTIAAANNAIQNSGIVSDVEKIKAAELIRRKNEIASQIERIEDDGLAAPLKEELKLINEELSQMAQAAITAKTERSKKVTEQIEGAEVRADLNSVEKVKKYLIDEIEAGNITPELGEVTLEDGSTRPETQQEWIESQSNERGFIIQNPTTGAQTVVINSEVASQEGIMTTDLHETGHAILYRTLLNDPKAAKQLGEAALRYLAEIDIDQLQDSDYVRRLRQYRDQPGDVQAEEAITLLSEALANGDIVLNKDFISQIKAYLRSVWQNSGFGTITFETDEDVINFIQDYNKSFAEGKLNKAQIKLANEGATVDITPSGKVDVVTDTTTKIKSSKAIGLDKLSEDWMDNKISTTKEVFERREKIEELELENTADELRAKLKTAKGKDKENIKLALEEKFRNVPELVEDSGVDIYTGEEVVIEEDADQRLINDATVEAIQNLPEGDVVQKEKLTKKLLDDNAGLFLGPKDKGGIDFDSTFLGKKNKNTGKPITRQEVLNEISSLMPGIIGAWTPQTQGGKASFGTYATSSLKLKLPGIQESLIGAKEAKQRAESELTDDVAVTEQKDFDVKDTGKKARKKKYVSSLPSMKRIRPTTTTTLKGGVDAKGKTTGLAKEIIQATSSNKGDVESVVQDIVEQTKSKEKRKLIKEDIGTTKSPKYKNFVDKIINDKLLGAIPAATIKRRLRNVPGLKITQTGTVKTKKVNPRTGKVTYFDKGVYKIASDLDSQGVRDSLREYFTGNDPKVDYEKRQQSLVSLLVEGMEVEAIQELKNDKAFMDKLQDTLDLKNIDKSATDYMDELADGLDKRTKEDTSFDEVTIKSARKKAKAKDKAKKGKEKFDKEADNILKTVFQDSFIEKLDKQEELQRVAAEERRWSSIVKAYITELKTKGIEIPWLEEGEALDMRKPVHRQKMHDWIFDTLAPLLPASMIEEGGNFIGKAKSYLDADGNKIRGRDNVLAFKDTTEAKTLAESKGVEYGSGLKTISITTINPKTKKKTTTKYSPAEQIRLMEVANKRTLITAGITVDGQKVVKRAVSKSFMEAFDTPAMKKQNEEKLLGLEIFALNMAELVKKDPISGLFLTQMMRSSSKGQSHFIRKVAPVGFMEMDIAMSDQTKTAIQRVKNKETGETEEIEYIQVSYGITEEHTLPATQVAKALTLSILKGVEATKEVLVPIKQKYMQGPVSKPGKTKTLLENGGKLGTDNILEAAGYAEATPSGWDLYNPNDHPFARMFNPKTALIGGGINPAKFIVPNFKEGVKSPTIEDKYNVNSSGMPLNKKSKSSLKNAKSKNSKINDAVNDGMTINEQLDRLNINDKAARKARKTNKKPKGISVFDFDDTLAYSNSKIIVTMPNGDVRKITPAKFAQSAANLESRGAKFDFKEFDKVVNGKPGPLVDKLKKAIGKFGNKDVFVLTARPQASAKSIQLFLKGIGIDIPLENITGLENGTPEAKANWILDKAAVGYNDFYFVDDAYANVKAVQDVLDQIDVKGKVQQAIADKTKRLDSQFNIMLEESTGVEAFKTYSPARAKTIGANKGNFEFFIPPSAEDFVGLLYKMLGKGKIGDRHMAFFKKHLLDPFNTAENDLISAKVAAANDFKELKKLFLSDMWSKKGGKLSNPTGIGGFTVDHAVRVYIWTAQGIEIPGLSKQDIKELNDFVFKNSELKSFADQIMGIQKNKLYPKPTSNWVGGTIGGDIEQSLNKTTRSELLEEWNENIDIIFSEKNLNKIEAIYGSKYRKSLEDIIRRMKSGSNRPVGGNKIVNDLLDWLNNSVGAVMFLNTRSGLLQLISNINFINWHDNNPMKAGLAFANQPQYWKDVMMIMNSDYLVNRRNGLKLNVSESEIAEASKKGGVKGVIALLLNKGFLFTRIADSLAIATGGATMYRNRTNTYIKEGLSKTEAEKRAFEDFYKVSEESQQSSRTDRISMQQASGIGRVILAFANTPMQYARLQKKAFLDLKNGRGDYKTNLSKIAYYGVVQNLIFNALQQAIFALAFGDDDEDQDKEKEEAALNVANGMMDSILRGLGWQGAAVSTIKNVLRETIAQYGAKSPKYEEAVWEVFDFSPPLDSKVRKMRQAARSFSWNKDEIDRRGFHIDNPSMLAVGQLVSAFTNVPLDRAMRKIMNIRQAVDSETELWQSIALLMGYSGWQLGLPYWGLNTTIETEEAEDQLIKDEFKSRQQELRDQGYKKIMNPKDYDEKDVVKITSYTGVEMYYLKTPKIKNDKKIADDPKEQRKFDSIRAEKKVDQVNTLTKYGLTKKEIRNLKYEKDRIEKILDLMEN
jgi:hypothetical protein